LKARAKERIIMHLSNKYPDTVKIRSISLKTTAGEPRYYHSTTFIAPEYEG